jgi:hypothetical protein
LSSFNLIIKLNQIFEINNLIKNQEEYKNHKTNLLKFFTKIKKNNLDKIYLGKIFQLINIFYKYELENNIIDELNLIDFFLKDLGIDSFELFLKNIDFEFYFNNKKFNDTIQNFIEKFNEYDELKIINIFIYLLSFDLTIDNQVYLNNLFLNIEFGLEKYLSSYLNFDLNQNKINLIIDFLNFIMEKNVFHFSSNVLFYIDNLFIFINNNEDQIFIKNYKKKIMIFDFHKLLFVNKNNSNVIYYIK